jgi:hypothetical protein
MSNRNRLNRLEAQRLPVDGACPHCGKHANDCRAVVFVMGTDCAWDDDPVGPICPTCGLDMGPIRLVYQRGAV